MELKKILEKYPLIEKIENYKNDDSEELTIKIKEGTTEIPKEYFYQLQEDPELGWSRIVEIILPNSVKVINDFSFYQCSHLINCRLPEELDTLDKHAFMNTRLENVTFPKKITNMGINCFINSILGNVTIRGIKSIPYATFAASTIENITIEEGIETIGERAFNDTKINGEMTLPSSLKQLDELAFLDADINELVLPEGLEEAKLGSLNFKRINKLTIPKSLTKIEDYAFVSFTHPFSLPVMKEIVIYLSKNGENLIKLIEQFMEKINQSTEENIPKIEVIITEKNLTPEAEEVLKQAQAVYPNIIVKDETETKTTAIR